MRSVLVDGIVLTEDQVERALKLLNTPQLGIYLHKPLKRYVLLISGHDKMTKLLFKTYFPRLKYNDYNYFGIYLDNGTFNAWKTLESFVRIELPS